MSRVFRFGVRLKIMAILTLWSLAMCAAVVWLQTENVRSSVREEVQAANMVTGQIMQRIIWINASYGLEGLREFLDHLGRVRSNDIRLLAADGTVLYQSPPYAYKAGQWAPAWFARWVQPPANRIDLPLGGGALGVLEIQSESSRSVLDGWQSTQRILGGMLLAQIMVMLAAWLSIHRLLRHLPLLSAACAEVEQGRYDVRLPVHPPHEASVVSTAFNRMVQSLAENAELRRQAHHAAERLDETRRFGRLLQQRLEQERMTIARELHDQMGQSLTAIRSLAQVLRRQDARASSDPARLIQEEAARLYDGLQGMIPRLRPLSLEVGLASAIGELVGAWQAAHACVVHLDLAEDGALPGDGETALAVYRIAQEALNNVAKHAQAKKVFLSLHLRDQALCLVVEDDGVGMGARPHDSGFGLRGMGERAEALGGSCVVERSEKGGVRIRAVLPFPAPPQPGGPAEMTGEQP